MSPYKDPNEAREYQRNYQRKRRAGSNPSVKTLTRQTLATVEDLRVVFERITNEVLNDADLDLGIKARVIAQLLKVGVDLIENGSLEQRVIELEKRAELSKYA